jgi:hypothetical protein
MLLRLQYRKLRCGAFFIWVLPGTTTKELPMARHKKISAKVEHVKKSRKRGGRKHSGKKHMLKK